MMQTYFNISYSLSPCMFSSSSFSPDSLTHAEILTSTCRWPQSGTTSFPVSCELIACNTHTHIHTHTHTYQLLVSYLCPHVAVMFFKCHAGSLVDSLVDSLAARRPCFSPGFCFLLDCRTSAWPRAQKRSIVSVMRSPHPVSHRCYS